MPLFTGWVCDCPLQSDRKSRSLTAYDDLYRCADINVADWYNSITYPVDIGVFLKSLLDYVGISYTGALEIRQFFNVRKTLDTNSLPFSMVIKAICQIIGGFGIINPNGEFNIVYFSNKGSVYELEAMSGFELEQYSVKAIDKVVVRSEETDVGGQYGDGNNAYIIQGNFLCFGMTADEIGAVANNLYMNVAGFSWRPCCFGPAISNPLIGCDGLRYHVTTSQGDSFETYIFNSYISGVQLFNQELESYGSEYRKETIVNTHTENLVTAYKVMKVKSTVDGFERSIEETNANVDGLSKKYATLEQNVNSFQITVAEEYTPLDKFNSMKIGAINILPDSNTSSLKAIAAPGDRYFSDSSSASTIEFITVTDAPITEIKVGIKMSAVSSAIGRNLTWRNIRLQDGETYTISFYARSFDAEKMEFRFRYIVNEGSYVGKYVIEELDGTWKKVSCTLTIDKSKSHADSTSDIYNIGVAGVTSKYLGTVEMCGFKMEIGDKATEWSYALEDTETQFSSLTNKYSILEQNINEFKTTVSETYSTKTETKTVETIATQTANKFNWIVKNETSATATNFTLTDRMAELTAAIISLNGDVKVNGDMIVDGAITSNKMAVGDFTNLVDVNPDTYNPRNYTIVTDDNDVKWFKFGSDTKLGYYSVYMNYLPANTVFNKGDKYLFRALVKASMVTSVGFRLRVFYSDGASPTYTNMASTFIDNVPTEQQYIQIPFTVNTLPTPGRPIKNIGVFLETRNTKLGTIYVRELTVHRMINNVLIADGAITADKIDVADLFAQNITVNGTFKSVGSVWIPPAKEDMNTLRDFVYGETTLTAAQKTAFDFNGDGTVDLLDASICKASVLLGVDIPTKYPNYNPVNSNVNVTINPKNPKKIIDITTTNSFGRAIDIFFGMDGLNVPSVDTGLVNCYAVQSQDDVIANYGTDNEIKLSELYGLNNMLKVLANKTVTAASDGTITLTFDNTYAKKISRMGVMFVQINDSSNSHYGYVAVPYMNNANSWGVSGDNMFNLYGGNGGIASVKITRSSTASTQTTIKISPNVSATYANKAVNVRMFCLSLGAE